MTEVDIAEVAQHSGLPVSTLRYYEQKGLIESSGRPSPSVQNAMPTHRSSAA